MCRLLLSCFLQLYEMSDELIVKSKNNKGDHSIFSNLDCNGQLMCGSKAYYYTFIIVHCNIWKT